VVLHKDRLDEGLLSMAETNAAEGLREGAVISAILGAAVGAGVVGPVGLLAGGALGALYGGIAGAIAGSGGPARKLEMLSKELALVKVLVIVEVPASRAVKTPMP
jgi:hypothetical protein